jgi:LmbE family N-acetylglucosaminyl deacetylase
MLPLGLPASDRPLRILCLGAHADDLEIGCGGTVLHLIASRPVACTWVVLSGSPERRREAEAGAARMLDGATTVDVMIERFPDSRFPSAWHELKTRFETLKGSDPDLILTHHLQDRHQDHRLVAELTWNTWRDHLILEYEIPKYEGDLGRPTTYVPFSREVADRKVSLLLEVFRSQRSRHWFDAEVFRGLMRIRGLECASASGYAEAFHAPKTVIHPGG